MIILAEQTGRERYNRLFKARNSNNASPWQEPAMTRRGDGPGPDMLAAIYERTAEQAAIVKLNQILQEAHDAS